MTKINDRVLEGILLAVILLGGGFLRLGWTGVNSFSFDEARVSQLALEMAREGNFAELGMQSSTGVPNFPAVVWLYAVPYAFSTSPVVATLFGSFLNWLGILAAWRLGRIAWGKGAGLVAAALFAFSPAILVYSRNIWSQNLLPPLAVLWALTGVEGIAFPERRRSGWLLGVHAFLAGFIGQVHIAGVSLVLGSVWLGIRYALWRRWRPILAGGAAAAAAAAPAIWIIGRFGTGAQADLGQILRREGQVNPIVFRHLWELATSWRWEWVWLNENWQWSPVWEILQGTVTVYLAAAVVFGGVMIANAVRTTWGEPRTAGHILTNLLPVWLLSAPLFFLNSKTQVAPHYQLASVPAAFFLAAAVVVFSRRRIRRSAVVAGFAMFCIVSAGLVWQALDLIEERLVEGGMGTPLKYPLAAVDALYDGRPVVVHAWGNQPVFDGDAAVFHVLLWDRPHRLVNGRSAVVIPGGGGHLLVTFDTIPAWQVLGALDQVFLEGAVQQLPRRVNEPPYMTLTVEGPLEILNMYTVEAPARLANGAYLLGWLLQPAANGQTRLVTVWELNEGPVAGQIQQFNHLYLADGPEPVQIQDVSVSAGGWRAGDQLITFAEFDLPEGVPFHFEIGMYAWPGLDRSPVLGRDPAADPLAPIILTP